MITGESRTVSKGPGATVIAGTVPVAKPSSPHHSSSRADRSIRHHAARAAAQAPGLVRKLLPTAPRQPFLRGSSFWCDNAYLLVAFGRQRTRSN